MTLFWQAAQPADHDLTLQLIDDQGQIITEDGSRVSPLGQFVQLRRVRVPIDLQTGRYRWRGSIEGQTIFEAGELNVTHPIGRLMNRQSSSASIRCLTGKSRCWVITARSVREGPRAR